MLDFIASLGRVGAVATPATLTATVAKNRYGAAMTYNQNTDSLGVNKYPSEFWAFKYNIAATSYVSGYFTRDDVINSTGRVVPSLYFQTDYWKHPTTGTIGTIPDYYDTAWTSEGAAVFSGAVAGGAKLERTPNHGQELYDISGGGYGYDVASDTPGTNNLLELKGVVDAERQYAQSNLGYTPYCFAYRNGRNDTPEVYTQYFISGRTTASTWDSTLDGDTSYGTGAGNPSTNSDRMYYIEHPSTFRFADYIRLGYGTTAEATAYMREQLEKTLLNNGFFRDFAHWHNEGTRVRDCFSSVRSILDPHDVHFADYEEAMRYMWARESVQSVAVSGNTVSISWQAFDLAAALTVPVSIKVDTTGTALAGKEIASSVGSVVKKYANVFVVEVPYNTASFTLSETSSPAYVDLGAPTISYQVAGDELIVTCSKPCKVALWKAARGAAETALSAPVRSNSLSTTHTFTVTSTDLAGDMYIGAMTDRKQSAVLGPVQVS